jgi:hypothetical protein
MNRPRKASRIAALIWAAAASLIVAASAWADPPGRVARLGYISGAVSFSPAGENDWVHAMLNRPLITGDRLWVVPGARAELQFGAAAIRIGSGTALNLLNLDDRVAQVELTQGTVYVRVRRFVPGQVLEIDTPNLAFSLRRAGSYRITVDPGQDSTTVIVREGEGDVFGDGAGYVVRQGNAYEYFGVGLRDFDRLDRIGADEFERWALERERRHARSISARYVSPDVIGYADLDEYGSWRSVSGYGSVWFPRRVSSDWAPYRDGHWSWIEPWGWTWIDEAPWGFTVSHYGRWAHMDNGWGWVPGPVRERAVYAPALVAFIGGAGASLAISAGPAIGWFPLGPREVYRPSYPVSRDYFVRVNQSNTVINNVTNFYNSNVNITYVNQRVPNAVIAVPQQAFVQSQPVARAAVRMNPQQIALPAAQVAAIAPVERSIIGSAAPGTKPPAAAIDRAVVAKTPPPPPPPAFQARQQALQASPGKPLTTADVERLRPRAPAADQTPAPRVITQAPAAPTTPMANVQPQRPAPGAQRGRPEGAPQAGVETGRPQPGQPAPQPGQPPAQPPVAQPAQPPGQASERPGLGRGRPEAPATTQPAPIAPQAQPAPTPPQAAPAPQPPGQAQDRPGRGDGRPGQDARPGQDGRPGQGRGRPDAPATAQPAAPAAVQPAPPTTAQPAPPAPTPQRPTPPQAQPAPTPPPQAAPGPQPPAQAQDRPGRGDDRPGQGRGRPEAPATAQPAPQPPAPTPSAVERRQGPPEGRGPDNRPAPPPQAAPQPAAPQPAPVARPQPAPQPPPPAAQEPRPAPPPQASPPPQRPPEQRAAPQPQPQPPQAAPQPPRGPDRAQPQPQPPQAAPQAPRGPERAQPQPQQQPQGQGSAAERKGPPEQRGQGKSDERRKEDEDKKKEDEKKGRGQ